MYNSVKLSLLAIAKCGLCLVMIVVTGCGGGPTPPPKVRANLASSEEIRAKLSVAGSGAVQEKSLGEEFGGEFATLKGKFVLNGTAPSNPVLLINKDQTVCKPGGKDVTKSVCVVGDNNELANVLVYAEVPAEWCHESKTGNTDVVEFDQKNCLFVNRITTLQTTQSMKILNSDGVGHNAELKPSKSPRFNQTIPAGGAEMYPGEGKKLKQEKSPFTANCAAHPWMQSFIIVRANGYYDVSTVGDPGKPDGTFELDNLPAGVPVKITVWHELSKGVPGSEVNAQPADLIVKKWDKRGSFTVNLEPNSTSDMTVAISSTAFE